MLADIRAYVLATLICVAATALAVPMSERFDLANIIMLFLLAVVIVALYLGRAPSVWAAFLSVACFDFFFVPPKYTFTVDDPQYILTFAIMLVIALVIGQLTAGLRQQALVAAKKERRAHALYSMASELAGALDASGVVSTADRFLREAIGAQAGLLMPDSTGQLVPVGAAPGERLHVSPLMASYAYNNTSCVDLDAQYPSSYFPLRTSSQVRGVLIVVSPTQSAAPLNEHKEFLETVVSLMAIVLERLHCGGTLQTAQA
jgi:two-component system sensor histidine kinase KdpD